ncbi:MAG: tRNA (adenosine(37)-N6)-threonylcarbamoyltransferase complex dimerization subunit type 1 TsaB [Terriglobales bacterium]
MTVLALETASSHGSLALLRDQACLALQPLETRNFAALLVPALQALLDAQGLELNRLDLLAVANGPGSFTGVRIGLATVKALSETLSLPAVAVGTLQAAASAATNPGPTLAAIDAGRGEIYYGMYPEGHEGVENSTSFALRLQQWSGEALTPDAALAAAHPGLRVIGPLLAPAVGRLAAAAWIADPHQAAANPLTLDARYLGARWER